MMEDKTYLSNLRPRYLNEYLGQKDIVDKLNIYIQASKARNETLDHILLYGPSGLGKTTLANIIANELGTNIKVVNGPTIEKIGDLAAILTSIEKGDVLFIDEIHRIPKIVSETLYSVMEDFVLTIIVPYSDSNSENINIELPRFTIVGATTNIGYLTKPLRSRFGIVEKLNWYKDDELILIVKRTAQIFGLIIENDVAFLIARRSRGTPRLTNTILKRVRDVATFEHTNLLTKDIVEKGINLLKIDEAGLDEIDRKYLHCIIERFHGGPVGIDSIASSISEEIRNLEEVTEPYLIQLGMVYRSSRGRIATDLAYKHLKIKRSKTNTIKY